MKKTIIGFACACSLILSACAVTTGQQDDEAAKLAYQEAYAAGYRDGHKEAQSHSKKYYEMLREAYRTTGGAGAGFRKDADGNAMVEETAPNGQKVWVYFDP